MKKYEYLGAENGESIDSIMGVRQAVQCLDLAGEIAADTKDVNSLIQLAKSWMEFGATVEEVLPHNPGEDDDDEKTAKGKKLENYGFAKAIIEKAGDEDGEPGVTDED